MVRRGIHHVEYWVADIVAARREWGWLMDRLGFAPGAEWAEGSTWSIGDTYVTFTLSPNLHGDEHDRRMPGLNHLAFHGGTRSDVDSLVTDAGAYGWSALYAERYPHAGGPRHYAAYLENSAGFKVEMVADPATFTPPV